MNLAENPLHYSEAEIRASEGERRSWLPVDLTDVLEGRYKAAMPTVGVRDDGIGLFYPGRLHTIASESEGGKTWLALTAAAHELTEGNAVVYLDFEDDEGGVVGRLLAMNVAAAAIRQRFAYIRPEDSVDALVNRTDLADVLITYQPTLCILDGVTEAMALHGLELKDNTDIAKFGRKLPGWIAKQGPAVAALDHVVKDREGRGRYAIGGVHKLNGVDGAAYLLDNRTPFAIGRTGRSTVLIAKDRPAQLRRHALPSRDGLFWFADLVIDSYPEGFVEARLCAPQEREDKALRPTKVMAKITKAMAEMPPGMSKNAIETAVGGKRDITRLALELLVSEGYVTQSRQGSTLVHTLVRQFEDD